MCIMQASSVFQAVIDNTPANYFQKALLFGSSMPLSVIPGYPDYHKMQWFLAEMQADLGSTYKLRWTVHIGLVAASFSLAVFGFVVMRLQVCRTGEGNCNLLGLWKCFDWL